VARSGPWEEACSCCGDRHVVAYFYLLLHYYLGRLIFFMLIDFVEAIVPASDTTIIKTATMTKNMEGGSLVKQGAMLKGAFDSAQ
jgi:hypothetical protein